MRQQRAIRADYARQTLWRVINEVAGQPEVALRVCADPYALLAACAQEAHAARCGLNRRSRIPFLHHFHAVRQGIGHAAHHTSRVARPPRTSHHSGEVVSSCLDRSIGVMNRPAQRHTAAIEPSAALQHSTGCIERPQPRLEAALEMPLRAQRTIRVPQCPKPLTRFVLERAAHLEGTSRVPPSPLAVLHIAHIRASRLLRSVRVVMHPRTISQATHQLAAAFHLAGFVASLDALGTRSQPHRTHDERTQVPPRASLCTHHSSSTCASVQRTLPLSTHT